MIPSAAPSTSNYARDTIWTRSTSVIEVTINSAQTMNVQSRIVLYNERYRLIFLSSHRIGLRMSCIKKKGGPLERPPILARSRNDYFRAGFTNTST
jgi:hypothetical protein